MTQEEKHQQIKNLLDYNEAKLRQVSFNNVKISILQMKEGDENSVERLIHNHFLTYQDEEEKQLLIAFFNTHKIK